MQTKEQPGESAAKNKPSPITILLLAVLALLGMISLGRAVQFTFSGQYGGIDFHSYWYSGLFVRQGSDPYAAYLESEKPDAPVQYITGQIDNRGDLNRKLARVPANTAPLLLLLSTFSWLPWENAKTVWFFTNLVLVGFLPLLAIRFLTPKPWMPWTAVLLTCLIFYALKGTRAALGTGQTTIFVLTLLVLALAAWRKSWVAAGLLLGVALSKYSIALPIFLFFLYKRQFKAVILSLVVQILGLLAISGFSGSSPLAIIQSYFKIMLVHLDHPGIHLAELFPPSLPFQIGIPILLTLVIAALLLRHFKRRRAAAAVIDEKFDDLFMLSILSIWTLLVAYHRPYDGTLILFFIILMIVGLSQPNRWQLVNNQRMGIALYFALMTGILITPYEQIGTFIPGSLMQTSLEIIANGVIVAMVSMLGVTFWLWPRAYEQIGEQD